MKGHSGVEGEGGVHGVHEAFFFVGLERKDCEPKVEGGHEDDAAEAGDCAELSGVACEQLLHKE